MLDSKKIREAFPSLSLRDKNNNQIIYLDGPGGTQVPKSVIDGISDYYKKYNVKYDAFKYKYRKRSSSRST